MKPILTTIFILSQVVSFAQTKAVTETGEEVILNKNGTWKYENITPSYTTSLDTLTLKKDANATFLIKGKTVKYGIYIDPKKWRFKADEDDNTAYEYKFTLKNGDAQAMLIPERTELTLELLKMAAIENAKNVSPDAHISREETRRVNGHIVTMLELRGSIKDLPFVYIGYYYVGKQGTIQFVAYTTESLIKEHQKDLETLLNGLTLLD